MSTLCSLFSFADLWTILSFSYTVFVVAVVVIVIAERREPVKTLAWVMVITMFPVGGMVLFVIFGQNHHKQRTFRRKELLDAETIDSLCRQQLSGLAEQEHLALTDKSVARLMLNNNKSLLTLHNRVRILNNGEQTFPDMFGAMAEARKFIHIEFFAIEGGELFDHLCNVLEERIRAGVKVRIIYDSVGSRQLRKSDRQRLVDMGAEVHSFMPVLVSRFTSTANYRNHRKIVVIDGRVGYTGGVNIADRYIYGRKNVGGIWRDTHLRVEGEAVAMLQAIFTTDWSFVTDGELLSDAIYFPPTDVTDVVPMQIATSGPDTKFAAIMQSYYAAICKAEKYIYISTPYLLPNQVIVTALQVAAMSGVDVRIAIPVRGDNIFVAWAGYSYIDALMDAGVKIYLYKKGFIHSKFIVIDDELCTIGSANLDNRSFDDDFEVQAIIYENSVAKELRGYFMNDLADSELITRQSWDRRSRLSKIMEPICRLLAPIF